MGNSDDFRRKGSVNPIFLSAVWKCESANEADQLLGSGEGYVYQRDKHPNADFLAESIDDLHLAKETVITASGMAAISAAVLAHLNAGDHILISDQLYGRTTSLMKNELTRFGVDCTEVNIYDLNQFEKAIHERTRMVVVETISNPLLRVANIDAIAEFAHRSNAILLVDNTFATPMVCKPIEHSADLVMESISKFINGHSDIMLGAICGNPDSKLIDMPKVAATVATWGFNSSPMDCWLASRGVMTLPLRIRHACANAKWIAQQLLKRSAIRNVYYPGLEDSTDFELAKQLFCRDMKTNLSETGAKAGEQKLFGHMLTIELSGGRDRVNKFINLVPEIPFFPSLGDICTSLSHPRSTSHRAMSVEEAESIGITEGMVRISIGAEDPQTVLNWIVKGLDALD